MKRAPMLLAMLVLASCSAHRARMVDGAPLSADGWPVRPAEATYRCPEGTDLIDAPAASGRRTVTCMSMGNPLPRGFRLIWNEERRLVSRFEFTPDGVPESRTRWYDDGVKAAEEIYEDGRLVRRAGWYVNGRKKLEMAYDTEADLLRIRRYQPDGSMQVTGQTRDGTKVGEWQEWRDGAMATLEYVDGVPHGEVVRHYPAGGVERGIYEAGQRHGKWVRTDRHGNPVREMSYQRGAKTGVYRLYHPNTQLREEGHYLDGKKHGPWKTWHPSGELESEAWFSCGTPVGPYHAYFPDGDPKKIGAYEDGRTVGEWQTFNDAGVVTQIEQYNAPTRPFEPGDLPRRCGE